VLGVAAAIVGVGMVLSVFFIPVSVPLLLYAYVRLRWAHDRLRRHFVPRRHYQWNVAASVFALVVLMTLAVALWPGEPLGYGAGVAFAGAELVLAVVAAKAGATSTRP
jgi:hypothetical protein